MTTFRDLEVGAHFEFVEGKAGIWEKVSPRRCATANPGLWYGSRRWWVPAGEKIKVVK